ncbi:MAG: DUF4349 domain-containing protein [Kouleothrix sp.]
MRRRFAGAPAVPATALDQANGDAKQPAAQPNTTCLVIKTAELCCRFNESARDAEAQVRTLVNQWGGYVVKVETTGADEQMASRVTFRVPAERFDDALAGVQGLAKKLLSRTASAATT